MKRALLLSVCLLVVTSMAFAQTGSIGLFSSPAGNNCDLYDTMPGLVIVYVVHVYTPGATASQFRVADMWGNTMMYLAEAPTAPYIKIGTCGGPLGNVGGCAIAYGGCIPSPNMILMIQYFASGTTPPCSYLQVMEDLTPPAKATVLVTDCADPPNLLVATGGDIVINPNETCMCNVPVEETTWGGIKSLYK